MVSQKCIKCGCESADVKYYGNFTKVIQTQSLCGAVDVQTVSLVSGREILKFTCDKCKYVWIEKPLDVRKRDKAIEQQLKDMEQENV